MVLPVILCGGSGTRLWPLSRQSYPKQFLALQSSQTLLQQTLNRLNALESTQPAVLVCSEEHRFIVAEQLRQISVKNADIILEPVAKNTAPALAVAALRVQEEDPVMLVLPADHSLENNDAFQQIVSKGAKLAKQNHIVTFGVQPSEPHTQYGYIKADTFTSIGEGGYLVAEFVEKPTLDKAQDYLAQNQLMDDIDDTRASNQWFWNSGIFMCRASVYLTALKSFRPDIAMATEQALQQHSVDNDFIRLDRAAFSACPAESIDYAVMEPAARLNSTSAEQTKVVILPFKQACWNDIGSFAALWQVSTKDEQGNVCKGKVEARNTRNSLIYSDSRLVATLGINELVIVDTKDALLVADKRQINQLKSLVAQIAQAKNTEITASREVFRPWGKYDLIDSDDKFKVKRLTVKPGGKLSLQLHKHRSEYWVVVSGVANIQNGDFIGRLHENESTYIARNTLHSLENVGEDDLKIIEVQAGDYLAEDDILRFFDLYGRQ